VNSFELPMKKLLLALPLLACFALPARGEGAIAIAIPDEGLRKGFAYGWHMRAKTAEDARKEALEACRDNAKSNAIPPGKCKVVEVFKGQCVAVAHDRHKDWWSGWGVGKDEKTATARAIKQCRVGGRACNIAELDCDR
jgi:hypothetical protein